MLSLVAMRKALSEGLLGVNRVGWVAPEKFRFLFSMKDKYKYNIERNSMRLSRAKLRTLIESIILENKGSRAPVPLSAKDLAAACIEVKCPDDKKANAVGFKGFIKMIN